MPVLVSHRCKGTFQGYGIMWYHPRGLANILFLQCVRAQYHIMYDSSNNMGFIVTKPDGKQFKFVKSSGGLYMTLPGIQEWSQ